MERVDVFVIGGGSTGSEVAFLLARRSDLRVALAERERLGGECNHYGCLPTKVMLRSAKIAALAKGADRFGVRTGPVSVDVEAVRRRARAIIQEASGDGAAPFEAMGIRTYLQEARLIGPHRVELADGTLVHADRIVLATGTRAAAPPIPGLDGGPFWTNREAIWSTEVMPDRLAVIGSGAVGTEFAQIYSRFGSEVVVLEAEPRILPAEDEACSEAVAAAFEDERIDVRTGVRIERAAHDRSGWTLFLHDGEELRSDAVLVATGREPVFDAHDLGAAGVELDDRGRPVLTETLRTTGADVWAAGDATGELLFTHVGSYEAGVVVDDVLGHPRSRDYRVVPRVTFCDPEVASVGLTEQEAAASGYEVVTSVVRSTDNERARIDGGADGLVKLVADARSGELLGGHMVGQEAGTMIHQVVAMMAARTPLRPAADAIYAYPTLSESLKEALGRLVHP